MVVRVRGEVWTVGLFWQARERTVGATLLEPNYITVKVLDTIRTVSGLSALALVNFAGS